MAKKYRDVVKILERNGWRRGRQAKGSHEIWVNPDGRKVTIALGGKSTDEVPAGTLSTLRKDTGIEELR